MVPADAPTSLIKERWEKLVMADAGIDRHYYGRAFLFSETLP
ncbi:TPA: hypothetical protein ACNVXO_000912 [Pseudomonas aeruginosa]|jgi:hypothetical protein|nr:MULTISPECIES: hypothetical protein [Pseudomonadota]KDD44158.1 hypothetical protein L532_0517 [Bordetella bronchiseptica OSU095]